MLILCRFRASSVDVLNQIIIWFVLYCTIVSFFIFFFGSLLIIFSYLVNERCQTDRKNLNSSLIHNQREEFSLILKQTSEILQNFMDTDYAGSFYSIEFKYIYDEKQTNLDIDDFIHGIKVLNAIVEINKTVDAAFNRLNIHVETYFSK